jgi:hypothetical protein
VTKKAYRKHFSTRFYIKEVLAQKSTAFRTRIFQRPGRELSDRKGSRIKFTTENIEQKRSKGGSADGAGGRSLETGNIPARSDAGCHPNGRPKYQCLNRKNKGFY